MVIQLCSGEWWHSITCSEALPFNYTQSDYVSVNKNIYTRTHTYTHTHWSRAPCLTSPVQVQACLALLLLDGLFEKQSRLSVEASAEALNSKIVVGENQLKLRLLLHRLRLILLFPGLCLTADLLLLLLASLHSLDEILNGCCEVFQAPVQNPSGGQRIRVNETERISFEVK